jgi:GntR family phosphonate transport system transcriptional regulator
MKQQRTREGASRRIRSGEIPLWRQIENRLRSSIAQGDYAPGSRLPPDRQIAAEFNANRLTARRALASLEQQGLIRIEHGNGTFVAENLLRYNLGRRVRFNQNLTSRDATPRRELLGAWEVKATKDVAARLGITTGDPVVKIDLLGFADEYPISVMSRFAPGERFDGLAAAFKREQSFTAALRQFGIEDYRRMLTEVTARLPTPFEARLLKQPKSQPILACESIDVDLEGVPISYQVGCFSGERVALVVEHDQKD